MNRKSGFTLIELLVVVAILALLVALLSGAIRKSMDAAQRRRFVSELGSFETAMITYLHDNEKPPIDIQNGKYEYVFEENNGEVFKYLLDTNNKQHNPLGKNYLDIHQLRTSSDVEKSKDSSGKTTIKGHVKPHDENKYDQVVVDPNGAYYRVVVNLKGKTCYVYFWHEGKQEWRQSW